MKAPHELSLSKRRENALVNIRTEPFSRSATFSALIFIFCGKRNPGVPLLALFLEGVFGGDSFPRG